MRTAPGLHRALQGTPLLLLLLTCLVRLSEAQPAISINNVSKFEGNSNTTSFVFAVSLSTTDAANVSVHYATTNGTAAAPADYSAVAGTLTFLPGQRVKTFAVPVNGDSLVEPDETFTVNLSSPTNGTILDGSGLGTIKDDDAPPAVTVNDVSRAEGNSSSVNATFTVSLSHASQSAVAVDYATSDGTATTPADYAALPSTTLTFTPGQITRTVNVPVQGDLLDENNETFSLNLASPVNATIADNKGMGTIIDNDACPSVSISDVTAPEGNSGTTTNAVFNVTLSAPSGRLVTVKYLTANGSAVAPADYTALALSTLTFNPGETLQQVTVVVQGDDLDEANEMFQVNLSGPGNCSILDNKGLGTITDDDLPPSVSITDVSVTEPPSGSVDAVFNVTLSGASGRTVTVKFITADGTAVAPGDYSSLPLTTFTFNPGETTRQVTVAVQSDSLEENDETFQVNLSAPGNCTIADNKGVGTIHDMLPTLSINDISLTEGSLLLPTGYWGRKDAIFTVTLSRPSIRTVGVCCVTTDGTAVKTNHDYTLVSDIPCWTLIFNPGETSKTYKVYVTEDTWPEPDEYFFVNLFSPTNATILKGQGKCTIINDD